MSVEFLIRQQDLEHFLNLVTHNEPPRGMDWTVAMSAGDTLASFSAGGEVAQYPIHPMQKGKARFPLWCLARVSRKRESNWVRFCCEDSRITCDNASHQSDWITVGCGSPGTEDCFPTPLELLLFGRLMDEASLKRVGLDVRVPLAREKMGHEIRNAFESLGRYGVTEEDLNGLVEKALERAEPALLDGRYSWMIPSQARQPDGLALALSAGESLRALDELFLIAGQFSTRAAYADLLKFIARFRLYSPYNGMLIRTQMPGATYVATPRRWYEKYKRAIHPGARPITILQPRGPVMFVFDVSETIALPGAPELPQSVTNPFKVEEGKENGQLEKTIENAKRDGVRVHQQQFGSQFAGSIQPTNSKDVFVLSEGPPKKRRDVSVPVRYEMLLNERQTREVRFATLVHELGHLYCGHLGTQNKEHWPDRQGLSKEVVECEAESVSYLVCTRLGIKTPSAAYISGYLAEDGKVPPISPDTVLKVAGMIYDMGKSKMPLRKDKKEPPTA